MSKDTIYREDAIASIKPMVGEFTDNGFMVDYERVLSILEGIPSADRPQGEWIDAEIPLESGGSMPIQVCNLCKTFYPLAYTGGGHRFCPNCGAKMKGADND